MSSIDTQTIDESSITDIIIMCNHVCWEQSQGDGAELDFLGICRHQSLYKAAGGSGREMQVPQWHSH
jgi:hypothetical protein